MFECSTFYNKLPRIGISGNAVEWALHTWAWFLRTEFVVVPSFMLKFTNEGASYKSSKTKQLSLSQL
jgi:hypothetical protein